MKIKDFKGVLALSLLSIFLFFVFYSIFRIPYGRVMAAGLPIMLFFLNFYTLYGDWLPFRRGPQVNTLSGVSGTQVGQPLQEFGGIETRRVAFPRNLVHREVKAQRESGLYWLFDFLFGTVTLEIQGRSWQWLEIIQEDLENPNGCLLFLGRIDGGDLRNPDLLQFTGQLDRQSKIITYVFSSLGKLEEQIANIANVKNLDAEQMASHLQGIADKVKNVKILTRQGSSGSEIASIGAELA